MARVWLKIPVFSGVSASRPEPPSSSTHPGRDEPDTVARPWHIMHHRSPCGLRATATGLFDNAALNSDSLALRTAQFRLRLRRCPLVAPRALSFVFRSVFFACRSLAAPAFALHV